ncbi:hypothetical protein AN958_05398 [Leucoagaricus sp. SymC.cos]|nr:hypothetical protein AN958_05398 [Leucoagaricus sp. SymC.cos]
MVWQNMSAAQVLQMSRSDKGKVAPLWILEEEMKGAEVAFTGVVGVKITARSSERSLEQSRDFSRPVRRI